MESDYWKNLGTLHTTLDASISELRLSQAAESELAKILAERVRGWVRQTFQMEESNRASDRADSTRPDRPRIGETVLKS